MEFLDNFHLDLFQQFFSADVRADALRSAVAGILWYELRGIRHGLEAVVGRVDNHEIRLAKLEDSDATGPAA